jgi:hypothetical protein
MKPSAARWLQLVTLSILLAALFERLGVPASRSSDRCWPPATMPAENCAALIAGQGLLFGSVTQLEYGAVVWAGFFLFVVAYEEPALGEQFGDEYTRYRANVRRWLPRITPWRG